MDKHIQAPITKEVSESLRAGDYIYITGTIYTARDAAHKGWMRLWQEGRRCQSI